MEILCEAARLELLELFLHPLQVRGQLQRRPVVEPNLLVFIIYLQGFRVQGLVVRIKGVGCRVHSFGFRVSFLVSRV